MLSLGFRVQGLGLGFRVGFIVQCGAYLGLYCSAQKNLARHPLAAIHPHPANLSQALGV